MYVTSNLRNTSLIFYEIAGQLEYQSLLSSAKTLHQQDGPSFSPDAAADESFVQTHINTKFTKM